MILLYIVARSDTGSVASDLSRGTTDIKTYHFKCVPGDLSNEDQVDDSIYPLAKPE